MAKKSQSEDPQPGKGRTFKPNTSQFVTLQIGEQITGAFLGAGPQTITDKRTRQPKDLWVLRLRLESGDVSKVPCAALMKQAWSDIVDEYGDGDEQSAIDKLRGKTMEITRGEDTLTKGGDKMGTYEITIFD